MRSAAALGAEARNAARPWSAPRHIACESGHRNAAHLRRRAHGEGKTMAQRMTPDLFQLTGSHIHITYTTSSIDGTPTMTYQDPYQGMSFSEDEIRTVECDVGTLVSVTLRMTVDTGSTSLSVLIPRVRIEQGTIAAIHTECVTTVHRFSVIPSFHPEQLDTYSVVPLHGTAQFVMF